MAKIGENVKIKLLKIALTGEIGSGKSTACKYFKELGAYIVNSDKIAHNLLSSKTPVGQKIIKFLGPDILEKEEISRKKIAEKVFNDKKKLTELESLIHPCVLKEIEGLYKSVKNEKKYLFFVVEIPLLFETCSEAFYDYIIVLTREIRKRVHAGRESRLINIEDKVEKADYVIHNDQSLSILKDEVKKISNNLIKLLRSTPLHESK